ncbi:MAG: hypothetical protein ACRBN8_26250 [Nannocystales bacterium]
MTTKAAKTLRSRLCAIFATTLGASSVAGCDSEMPGVEGDTETETGDDDMAGTDDSPTPDDEDDASSGGAPADSDGPDDPVDPADDTPFDDDPLSALGALSGMAFICYDAEDTSLSLFFDPDGVTVRFEDETTSVGTYDTTGGSLTLSFPELGFTEGAVDAAVALDALVYFETPSLQCGAYSLDHGAAGETDVVDCPTIKYIPETSWENNQFHFSPGGYVRRRRWTELPAVPDTLYAVRLGVYRVVQDRMFIVLPFEDEGEQWLTGTVTGEGLYIDQLEPEQGACQ